MAPEDVGHEGEGLAALGRRPFPELLQGLPGPAVAQEEEVRRPPAQTHQGQEPVAGPGPQAHDLLGQGQPGLGVARPQLDMVEQRQGLGRGRVVAESPDPFGRGHHGLHRRPLIDGLGRLPDHQPGLLQRAGRDQGPGPLPQRLHRGPGHHVALLVDPDPAHPEGGGHEPGVVAGRLGRLGRLGEGGPGVREPAPSAAGFRRPEKLPDLRLSVAPRGHPPSVRGVPSDGTGAARRCHASGVNGVA